MVRWWEYTLYAAFANPQTDWVRNVRLPMAVGVAVAGLLLADHPAASQQIVTYAARPAAAGFSIAARGHSFGPIEPYLVDAVKRSAYALTGGAIFMAVGLGFDRLNASQCGARSVCPARHTVQTGMSFAFLGAVTAGTGPQLSSNCSRSGRAILGIIGAAVGVSTAAAIADVRLLNADTFEPATFSTMSSGLLGLGVGTGVATAIC